MRRSVISDTVCVIFYRDNETEVCGTLRGMPDELLRTLCAQQNCDVMMSMRLGAIACVRQVQQPGDLRYLLLLLPSTIDPWCIKSITTDENQ